jgi:hypothetical protein
MNEATPLLSPEELARRIERQLPMILHSEMPHAFEWSKRQAELHQTLFSKIETFSLFIGYPRSGHSLVGAWLDAHPDMVCAHELNALELLRHSLAREQILCLLLENSRVHAEMGRVWAGYSYRVPGQWQGRFRELRVAGDKKGYGSTLLLQHDSSLIDRLQKVMRARVKFLHVVRDPLDNISTALKRNNFGGPQDDLALAIDVYFKAVHTVDAIRQRSDVDMLDIYHERVIENPERELKRICGFLEIEAPRDYLEACAKTAFQTPHKTRTAVGWTSGLIGSVRERMSRFEFLDIYTDLG